MKEENKMSKLINENMNNDQMFNLKTWSFISSTPWSILPYKAYKEQDHYCSLWKTHVGCGWEKKEEKVVKSWSS